MGLSPDVFFSSESAYIELISARSKGRAPSYPTPDFQSLEAA
jgi:hypothetical protein